jgi:poly-gamma-glutamate synthesis protein (capsule biosynthesis protein)
VYTARLAFVGDVMCHIEQLNAARIETGVYDFRYMFRYVAPYIKAADYAIANLETTLVESGFRGWPMFRSPKALAEALLDAGFDMVTTGNNHSFDAFAPGVRSTIEILNETGLAYTGTYLTPECRDDITLIEVNGFTFAILNFTMHTNGICLGPDNFMVKIIYHDLVEQATIDYEMISSSIARARALNPDFVVVLPHIGIEYYGTMNRAGGGHQWDTFGRHDTRWFNWMRTLHFMLESGADIIMSHHPHVLLPAEFVYVTDPCGTVRRTFVAYSMGNFISAQYTSPRDVGAIFYLDFDRCENGTPFIHGASYTPTFVRRTDATNPDKFDFTIMPVTQTLRRILEDDHADLRPSDIDRITHAQNDATHMLSGSPIAIENMQYEYPITRSRTITQFPGLPLWESLPWR